MILTDILEKNVKNVPNKVAFTMRMGYRTLNLTYKQVYNLAQRIAIFLKKNGLKKGDTVLIFAPNSPYWGTLFWGCMLNGYVAVPLNIQSTSEMIKKIVDQTNSKIIFKSRYLKIDLLQNLKTYEIEFIDELVKEIDHIDFVKEQISENDLVEILYTSGTTGDPKGVLLTHKNIYSNLIAISKIFYIDGSGEKLLSILPLTHIFEQTIGFFLPFFYHAQIVYAHSYAALLDLMQEYKITKLLVVPEFLKILMLKIKAEVDKKNKTKIFNKLLKFSSKINNKFISRIIFRSIYKKFGGKLDTIASGGAFLDPELEKEWNALGFYILQGYGLTETSPVVTCNSYKERKLGSVGKVLDGIQLKISDDGEILVKGTSVFSGYFKNEEKTKESFTSDGWFKTGDMGYIDDDDFLFLKGRKKYIIVGPGAQNVFPEDIELELNKIEGVKDSCVLGLEKTSGMVEIHAVLLLEKGVTDIQKIIDLANENLASYQKIMGFTVYPYDDFPRSATKKVKKEEVVKFLKAKENGELDDKKFEKELTSLMKILSQITSVDVSKIHNDTKIIPDLNIDSLMRVELVLRIEQNLNVILDESMITDKTTVIQLEKIIKEKPFIKKFPPLKEWPRSWWASAIRIMVQPLIFLFTRIFVRLKVEGIENLKDIKFPVIFMPNHISYIDSLPLLMSLPFYIRKRVIFAAAADVLYGEFRYLAWLAELFGNSVIFPRLQVENIKLGLDYIGRLLDKNYSIVFFPEGKVSLDGNLQPLRRGTGLLAVEMNVAIVPVKIIGAQKIVPYEKIFPRKFGKIIVRLGKPLKFKKTDNYDDVLRVIEMELRKM